MALYTLSGSGIQSLTAGTVRLYVLVTTLGSNVGVGRAYPSNYYDMALLRFGRDDYWFTAFPLEALQQVLLVPDASTHLGYALLSGTVVEVDEDATVPPPSTFVSTNLDGGSCTEGTPVTLTFGRTDAPNVSDYIGVVDSSWAISYGRAFGYQATPPFPYTSGYGSSPGGTASASGSFSDTIHSPFGSSATLHAVYVDGGTNTVIATGPAFSYSP